MINLDRLSQMASAMQANQGQPTFAPVVGRAPPQQPLPTPMMGNHMIPQFSTSGPYGAQALQLAGLLGNQGQVTGVPYGQQFGGLLGNVMNHGSAYMPGLFMPGFRPGIDEPIRGGGGRPKSPVRVV